MLTDHIDKELNRSGNEDMKKAIKKILQKILPSTYDTVSAFRSRKRISREHKRNGLYRLSEGLADFYNRAVVWGPFSGMLLSPSFLGQSLLPKQLGTYEMELHSFIRSISHLKINTVINIGSSDGYYSVGFGRMFPQAVIYAFDLDWGSRRATVLHAHLNSIQNRVKVSGRATHRNMESILQKPGLKLVVMDIEGGERALLNLSLIPSLKDSFLLIELHPGSDPNIQTDLSRRIAHSHEVIVVDPVKREGLPSDLAISPDVLCGRAVAVLVDEGRGHTPWLTAIPKSMSQHIKSL